jgi:hypothetical protein
MEIAGIILFSLLIAYSILQMVKESFKRKWYKLGYIEAAMKYEQKDNFKGYSDYSKEAGEKFDDKYGFDYP